MDFSLSNYFVKKYQKYFQKNQLFYQQMAPSPLKSDVFWIFTLKLFCQNFTKIFSKNSTFPSADVPKSPKNHHFLSFSTSNILSKNVKNMFKKKSTFFWQMAPSPLKGVIFWVFPPQIFYQKISKIFSKIFIFFISRCPQVL